MLVFYFTPEETRHETSLVGNPILVDCPLDSVLGYRGFCQRQHPFHFQKTTNTRVFSFFTNNMPNYPPCVVLSKLQLKAIFESRELYVHPYALHQSPYTVFWTCGKTVQVKCVQ